MAIHRVPCQSCHKMHDCKAPAGAVGVLSICNDCRAKVRVTPAMRKAACRYLLEKFGIVAPTNKET